MKAHVSLTIISCPTPLTIRNLSNKYCIENQDTFYVQKLFFEDRAVYEIMWKNVVQTDKPQMTIKYGACAVYAG
jgi:hypothetical protein